MPLIYRKLPAGSSAGAVERVTAKSEVHRAQQLRKTISEKRKAFLEAAEAYNVVAANCPHEFFEQHPGRKECYCCGALLLR